MKNFNQIKWTDIPRGQFDAEYFSNVLKFVSTKRNQKFEIEKISREPEKFVQYIKYYLDCKRTDPEFPDIHFSNDYTQIYIN